MSVDDPDQDDGFGRKLNDLSPSELLHNAHWAHRLIDALWDGEFECATPGCGRQTNNGVCHDCMHRKSPVQRADLAESVLCALAFEHMREKRDYESHAFGPPVLEWYPVCPPGECIFCDADRAYSAEHGR